MLWIGTSGFQYPEWKGSFYPEDLPVQQMLRYYSSRFGTTEINYSFYRLPSPRILETWGLSTPPSFRFSLKAPRLITHLKKLRDSEEVLGRLSQAWFTLGRKRAVVLFQLPPTFKKDVPVFRDFLASIGTIGRSAFEFRNDSWMCDEVFDLLRKHGAALCVSDRPEQDVVVRATAEFGYFRLRREDYRERDLKEWADVIAEQSQAAKWKDVFVYFKHEDMAVGPRFAQTLRELLTREKTPRGLTQPFPPPQSERAPQIRL